MPIALLGLIHTAWIGALVVLLALALSAWSGRLDWDDPTLASPVCAAIQDAAGIRRTSRR